MKVEGEEGMEIYGIIICLILAILALWDAVKMEIPIVIIVAGSLVRIIQITMMGIDDSLVIRHLVMSVIPGVILCLIHLIWKDKVGGADGPVMLIALVGSTPKQFFIAMIAVGIISFVTGLVFLICKKNKTDQIPFVPVIAAGTVASYLLV